MDGEAAGSPEWAGLRAFALGEFEGDFVADLSRSSRPRMLSIEKEFWLVLAAGAGLLSTAAVGLRGLLSAAEVEGSTGGGVGTWACRANAALGALNGKGRGPSGGGGGKVASGGREPTAANGERCMKAGW